MTGNAATDAALTAAARLSFSNFICWEMLPELEDLALPVALGTAPVADAAPAFPAPGADAAGFGPALGEGGSMVLCRPRGGGEEGPGGGWIRFSTPYETRVASSTGKVNLSHESIIY